MKVKLLDVWEESGGISGRYEATFPGREPMAGTVGPIAANSDEDWLESAIPLIRARHNLGPTLTALKALVASGKEIDDQEDAQESQGS